MKKNKFIYSLSAIALACIISFSGLGNSYIQVHATSVGIEKGVWNDDVSAWENIRQYIQLFASAYGIYVNPSWQTILWGLESHNDFYNFMISDGYSEDDAQETVHGGGGHVRDGISVDDNGNLTFSDEVADLFHGYILDYVDSNCGFVLVKTQKASDVGPLIFTDKVKADNFVKSVNNFDILWVGQVYSTGLDVVYIPSDNLYNINARDASFVITSDAIYWQEYFGMGSPNSSIMKFSVIEDDWTVHNPYWLRIPSDPETTVRFTFDEVIDPSVYGPGAHTNGNAYIYSLTYKNNLFETYKGVVTSDGRYVKVWYDIGLFKTFDYGNQMFYATDSFNNYDSTIDNSTTITSQEYAYYTDNSSTIYQTIQNNINNYGGELDNKTVQDIVDSAVQDIKDSIANSGNGGSGDSSDGGNGIGNLVDGIGKLLDTILSLIGKVMGVVADFTQSILDLFSGFTDFTDGFSNFLSGAFSFIPQEIWNVIQVGLSLMILLAVIKFLRK